jgi:hypothetical protein
MMRRTPLKRSSGLSVSSGLSRTTRLRVRGNTKHARRERGDEYMAWTSRQRCFACRFWQRLHLASGARTILVEDHLKCDGRIEVDHAGCRFEQGDGKRAYDWTVIPLCTRHHRMRTSWAGTLGQAGIFFGYSREAMRRWCDAAIALQHELAGKARVEVPTC